MGRILAFAALSALSASPALADEERVDASGPVNVEEVIVTGTRVAGGLMAQDSPAPIQVVGARVLDRAVSPDLINTLALVVPSFNAQAIGGDTANETLSARLRGLSPNHVLVLINGKRRHGTANLAILSSPFQGGAAADLNFSPAAAIEKVEVLQDGAAAQYGSDAIAGVINIILKRQSAGGLVALSGGGYFDGDCKTGALTANIGLGGNPDRFLTVTAETRYHDYSNRGGPDQRVERAIASGAQPTWRTLPGYPWVNKIFGDARYQLNIVSLNAGMPVTEATRAYAFGTWGKKYAAGWANFRLPTRLPALYPRGFDPLDTTKEMDAALTVGLTGQAASWNWDLATTWGQDAVAVNVTNSANVDLFNDTGATPSAFNAGKFIAGQWTTTLDVSREFGGFGAGPATLALGLERRDETYEIRAGDPASRYKAGSQSYPGFSLTDAGRHKRDSWAAYADLALAPTDALRLDLAVRHERFSDFGDTTVGKITGRYDFNDRFALRGTASTGFRAPTLAESYYSATNVQPNSAFVQLPPNAAAAALIGISPLSPEKSRNLSMGFVVRPAYGTLVTLDVYRIEIDDRVVGSGTLYGTFGGAARSPAVNAAIRANGNVLENVPFSGINVFSNGLDTRTRGADLVVTTQSELLGGSADWTLAANWNETKVTKVRATPVQLSASGQSLFDKVAISTIETAAPKAKVVAGVQWRKGAWSVEARETWYGQASRWSDPGDGTLYHDKSGSKVITDLSVTWNTPLGVAVQVGANNLFDTYPDRISAASIAGSGAAGNPAVEVYPLFAPWGINGGYYYAKLSYRF